MVETHKRKRKNTVITKITLTISNAEHIKQTLSTNKPYCHQQHGHLPKISQNIFVSVFVSCHFYAFTGNWSQKAFCIRAVCASVYVAVIVYHKFVNTISYKLLVWISPNLQLRCSWGQSWTDKIL